MSSLLTSAGTVEILTREESFAELARRINALAALGPASVGLSGGSTLGWSAPARSRPRPWPASTGT